VVLDPQEGGSTSGTQPGNIKIQPNPNPLGTKIHLRNKTKTVRHIHHHSTTPKTKNKATLSKEAFKREFFPFIKQANTRKLTSNKPI
jgi:hypothetical protein